MIRAGWKLEFRVHGLTLPKPDVPARAVLKPGQIGEVRLDLVFCEELREPITVIGLPRYVPSGHQMLPASSYQPSLVKDYTALGSFLTVIASRMYEVPEGVETTFLASPQEQAKSLPPILESRLQEEMRSTAIFAVGACAVREPDAVFELRAEQQIYWYTNDRSQGFADSTEAGQSVGSSQLNNQKAQEMLTDVVATLTDSEDTTRRLQRASFHYLRGRREPPLSIVRFLEMFLVLEALSAGFEPEQDREFQRKATELRSLVEQGQPELSNYVRQLTERPPSLNQSFQAMATKLQGSSANLDIELFRKINRLRGSYVHGRHEEPQEHEAQIFRFADELAQRYLRAQIQFLRPVALSQGRIKVSLEE